MPEEVGVEFAQHFGDLIRRRQVHGHEIFGQRQGCRRAVDRAAGRRVDQLLHLAHRGVLVHSEGAQTVHLEIPLRVVHGVLIGKERGEVVNHLGPVGECVLECRLVGNRTS